MSEDRGKTRAGKGIRDGRCGCLQRDLIRRLREEGRLGHQTHVVDGEAARFDCGYGVGEEPESLALLCVAVFVRW
jgi:hypothetical protein